MDMFRMFKPGMDLMGDADSALYVEPTSMAQIYDLMYAGAGDIGLLPPWSCKTKEQTEEVYMQERIEVLHKILSYKDCQKVDCGIVVPTCLHTPTLVLPPSECMRQYHDPGQWLQPRTAKRGYQELHSSAGFRTAPCACH